MQISRSRVQGTVSTARTVACVLADHVLQDLPVAVVFAFERRVDEERLRAALVHALDACPLFAGRLRCEAGRLSIDCNNQGADFSVHEENKTLPQALANLRIENKADYIEQIVPSQALKRSRALLTARLNHYTDGGSTLGLCWHHSVGDMRTFMCLMSAWTDAFNDAPVSSAEIASDRPAYLESRVPDNGRTVSGLRYLKASDLMRLGWYMAFRARRKRYLQFYFTEGELANMKRDLSSEVTEPISRSDALCAHMFSIIASQHGWSQPRWLSIAVDIRRRTGLPENLAGSMISTINVECDPGRSPAAIAAELRQHIASFAESYFDYFPTVRFVNDNGGMTKIRRFVATGLDPVKGNITFSNWAKFGVYDLDFAGQKPMYFGSLWDLPFPWLGTIVEGFANRGMIVSLALPNGIADAMLSKPVSQNVHRYRDPSDVVSREIAEVYPWLA